MNVLSQIFWLTISIITYQKCYFVRWGVESSFRKLKYTKGLSNFQTYKSEYIKQEIWDKEYKINAYLTFKVRRLLPYHSEVLRTTKIYMYVNKTHSVEEHIVSVSKPYLRPISEEKPDHQWNLVQNMMLS